MKSFLWSFLFLQLISAHAYGQTFLIEDKVFSANFSGSYAEFENAVTNIDQAYLDYKQNKNIKVFNKIQRKYSTEPVWYAFTVKNTFSESIERIIQFPFGCTDEMELYVLDNTTQKFEKIVRKHSTPLIERDYEIRRLSAGLNFEPLEEKLIIAKLKSFHQVSVGFDIYSTKKAYEYEKNYKTIAILYCGVALGLFLYNLFIAATSRKKEIWAYVGLLFSLTTLIMFIADIPAYFGVVVPLFFHRTLPLHSALIVMMMNLFTMSFLKTKLVTPRVHKVMLVSTLISVIGGLLSFIDPAYHVASVIIKNLTTIMLVMSLVLATYITYTSKSRPAFLFTIATSSLFISGLIYMLTWSFGIIPRNFMTSNIILLGSAIEMVLFSLAIADSFKKEISNEFLQRQDAELQLKKLNSMLEKKVKEKSNQLIQSQKRGALGEMASGIAHEINSPLSAIFNQLQFMFKLLDKSDPDIEKLKEINLKSQRIVSDVFGLTNQLKTFANSYDDYRVESIDLEKFMIPIRLKIEEISSHHRLEIEGAKDLNVDSLKYPLFCVISSLLKVVAQVNERVHLNFKMSLNGSIEVLINAYNRQIPSYVINSLSNPFQEFDGSDKGSGLELSLAKDALEMIKGSVKLGQEDDNFIFKLVLNDVSDKSEIAA